MSNGVQNQGEIAMQTDKYTKVVLTLIAIGLFLNLAMYLRVTPAGASLEVSDLVRTRQLEIVNVDGKTVIAAGAGANGVGVLTVANESGQDVVYAVGGGGGDGNGGEGEGGGGGEALERAGLTIDDIDVIELNEAFAAQSLAVIKEAGFDQEKLNLDGGAIAIGHPLGASGARITGKAASIMRREGKELALATMCIGGGQGTAVILEKV